MTRKSVPGCLLVSPSTLVSLPATCRTVGIPGGAPAVLGNCTNGLEADLLIEIGTRLQPVEIKSGQTVTRDYVKAGQASARFAGDEALPPWLIYGGDESCERSGLRVIGWRNIAHATVASASTLQ